jgi:aminoglycoside 2'-N-acetyltransferase I
VLDLLGSRFIVIIKELVELDPQIESSIQEMLDLAYNGDFSSEDWGHASGGLYFVGYLEETIVAHGSVVPREMLIDGRRLTVGYVEAVAVLPAYSGQGLGSLLMRRITEFCRENYALSMLSTDEKRFYERHGWRQFNGESFIAFEAEVVRSADEDEGLMFLPSEKNEEVDIRRATCQARSGDSW